MSPGIRSTQGTRWLRWLVAIGAVLLLVALVSWLALPGFVKSTLEREVAVATGREFSLGKVTFNPFSLTVTLGDIHFKEADKSQDAVSVGELVVQLSPLSVIHFAPVIHTLTVDSLHVVFTRTLESGKEVNNFSDVLQRIAEKPSKGEPARFAISNIQLTNGQIVFSDKPSGQTLHLNDLNFSLPYISTFASASDDILTPQLSVNLEKSSITVKGQVKPFAPGHDAAVSINLQQVDVRPIIKLLPVTLPLNVQSSLLSTDLNIKYADADHKTTLIVSGMSRLNTVKLATQDGEPLFHAQALSLNLEQFDLSGRRWTVSSLELDHPETWIGLKKSGLLNVATLSGNKESDQKSAASEKFIGELKSVKIRNGIAHWFDETVASTTQDGNRFEYAANEINFSGENVSLQPDAKPAKMELSFGTASEARAKFEGLVDINNPSVSGHAAVEGIDLHLTQAYLNRFLNAGVTGTLAIKSDIEFKEGQFNFNAIAGQFDDFAIRSPLSGVSAHSIAWDGGAIDIANRQIKMDNLILDQIHTKVFRGSDGVFNLMHLLRDNKAASSTVSFNTKVSTKSGPAWRVELGHLALRDSRVTFDDTSVQPAVAMNLDAVNLTVDHFSTDAKNVSQVTLQTVVNKSGKLSVDGNVALNAAHLNVNFQKFSFATLQPYFTEFLNIDISKGDLSLKGKFDWSAPMEWNYRGDFALANLATTDKEYGNDFLKWQTLNISGIDTGSGKGQPYIKLGNITLSNFYARAILSEKGELNLRNIMVKNEPAPTTGDNTPSVSNENKPIVASESAATKPAWLINIGQINLDNGTINYTDNFIKPHYSMRMTSMSGNVGTIDSSQAQPAPIILNGKVDDDAPVAISGTINPLFKPMMLDIKMTANGVDLPHLTAYSAKYAGYPIEKGKLSLAVEYQVKENQLTANNSLKIEQLTFGEKVDSPDATHLPVPFLVSLLTDSNGQINLDLPISGSINDPQFSVGGLIVQVIVNVLEKVVTSPFSLLSHMLGGSSEEFAYIEFAPGSPELTDASKTKLDGIAKVLDQKPALQLNLTGRADMDTDQAGWREHMLNSQVRKIANADKASSSATVSPADYANALEKVYSAAKFDKPKNFIGLSKSLPEDEMKQLLLSHMTVGEDDLRNLALRREAVVRSYLTENDHVPIERVFSIAPRLSGEGIKDKGAVSRVDLDLKMD